MVTTEADGWDMNSVVGEKFRHSRSPKGTWLSPTTQSNNLLDLGVYEMSGEPWSMGSSADVM